MASSSRALNAILPQIATAPYEAHQKARTFAARYVKSNQLDTAIDVLFQSARELLKTGQPGSGVDDPRAGATHGNTTVLLPWTRTRSCT